ncbi:hypothetical protein PA0241 [Candidatus Phytoplasma australiense]|uniref:Uncharacterized protein n=2 Tax=Phytoplasma australiense TaxID=59748 RepID=B1V9F4_PHYAS|nr:hypothetical protein PA0241 [Candidatus Phytoplasma australiense]
MNNYPNYPTPFPQKNNKLLYSIIAIVSVVFVIFAIIFFYNKTKPSTNNQNSEHQETPNNRNTSRKPNSQQKHTPRPENPRQIRTAENPSEFSDDDFLPPFDLEPQDEEFNTNASNPQFYTNT